MADKPTTTAEYFATLSAEQRATLTRLRDTIHAAAPDLHESFSYAMPAYALAGRPVIWYAAWKQHYSLYPIGAAIVEAHADESAPYETAKGTIRFPATEELPYDFVTTLVKARVAEFRQRGK